MSGQASDEESEGYSIRVAARLTGISADQLRVWERRYSYPRPRRNSAGNRVYSDPEIKRLTLIGQALNAGYRAKDAINASPEELQRVVEQAAAVRKPPQTFDGSHDIEHLIGLLASDQLHVLRSELRRLAASYGPKQFVAQVVSRFTDRVGQAWASGEIEVRHEHLASEILSTQLRMLMSAYDDASGSPTVVLATFPNEHHALGLEMAALYLAAVGAKPRLLGINTPVEQIVRTAASLKAEVVGISISLASDAEQVARSLGELLRMLPPRVAVWVGGQYPGDLRTQDPRVRRIRYWEELESALVTRSAH